MKSKKRKQVEASLVNKRNFIDSAINSLPGIFCVFDKDGRILRWNQKLEIVSGYSAKEISNMNPLDFISEEEKKLMKESIMEVFNKGKSSVEAHLLSKDGSKTPYLFTAQHLIADNQNYLIGIGHDITKRRQLEETLQESEKKYRNLVDNVLVGIYTTNLKGVILYVNEALCKMLEFESPEEMMAEGAPTKYKDPKNRKIVIDKLIKGHKIENLEVVLITKTGKPKDVILSATLDGDTISGMIMDITVRKQAEEEMRKSKELFEKIFFSQQDAIFILDSATPSKIIDSNPGVTKVFGYTRQEIIGKTTDILHIDDTSLKKFRKYLYPAIAEHGFLHLNEYRMKRKDGTVFATEHSVMPLENKHGKHIGWVSVVRDITERKQVQEQLQNLSRRLMEVQESERRFLASELHDQIGQNLTALSINLNFIRSRFSEEVDIKIVDRLEDSLKLVEETIERMRSVMAELRPPVLDDYGLAVALRWYTERFSERNAVVTVVQEKEFISCLPLTVETALFRIVQEVLTNVSKHANAKHVIITLERIDGVVQLVVSDDGVGFDPPVLRKLKKKPGWGLITIEERAKALGGDVYVKSAHGKGTQIIVQVPC